MSERAERYRWWRYPSSRGASFAVKRSELDAALGLAPAGGLREVVLATHTHTHTATQTASSGVPMPAGASDAGFRPLACAAWSGLDGRPAPLTADVSFFSVPRDERAELSALMRHQGLPLILGWIRGLETAPETRRNARHRLAVYLNLDRPLAQQLESELDEERRRGREVVDHDAHFNRGHQLGTRAYGGRSVR